MITQFQATRMAQLHWKHLVLEPVTHHDGIFEFHDPRIPQTVFVIDGRHHSLDFPSPRMATEIFNRFNHKVSQFEGPDSFRFCEPHPDNEAVRFVPIYFTGERPK